MILAWFHNLTLMEMQECAWKTFMWTLIFNTSSVMYFRWVCGWRKQLFWGKKFLSSYFYTCGKTTQVRIWSLCRRIFFFFLQDTSSAFLFFPQAKEPSVVLLPRSPAGLVQVLALLRALLGWAQLGWADCAQHGSAASPGAAPVPESCCSSALRGPVLSGALFTLNNPPCY